jgi:hypothetical protein
MRILAVLPVLVLAAACVDTTPVGPPDDAGLTVDASVLPAAGTSYSFHASVDPLCGPAEGCSGGTSWATPSGVLHGKDVTLRLVLTGPLAGEAWVSFDYGINLGNGKGVGHGVTVLFNLTDPGSGSFECTAGHGGFDGYMPPLFAFVEHTTYLGCHGSGDFDGMGMMFRMTNEANPGIGEYEGTAQVW